jgi:hypothetical protein
LGLFENILVAKFGAKIRRRGLKNENDRKNDPLILEGQRSAVFYRILAQANRPDMKKILLALLLGLSFMACSKSSDNSTPTGIISASQVPSGVMTSFNTRYPTASGQIEWEKEDGNTYKVKFFLGAQRWQAIFTSNGSFVSEKQI